MKNLISELKAFDINLSVDHDQLVVDFDGDTLSDELISKIKANKKALIEYLNKYTTVAAFEKIPVAEKDASYPTTNAQKRLWVLGQFEGGSDAYNMPFHIILNSDYDVPYFKQAIDLTIERHEVLRTVFESNPEGELRQIILDRSDLGFELITIDFRENENKEELAKVYIEQDAYKPFDFSKGPLIRAALLQLEDDKYIFYYNMHHIITDGWSMHVLAKDVFEFYNALKENRKPQLLDLTIQYKDYSLWLLSQLNDVSNDSHKTYWKKTLAGELPLIDLPFSKPRPKFKTYNGFKLSTSIDATITNSLRRFTKEKGGSLFMALMASWNVLINRYTGLKDVIIGTPIAGRDHADLENQIGFYVNTLALRNQPEPSENFSAFYEQVKANIFESYKHQMYPVDHLIGDLNLLYDTSRSPLFDMILTLQNIGEILSNNPTNIKSDDQIIDQGVNRSKFDLDINFVEDADIIRFEVVFNVALYDKEMIERLMQHFKSLLRSILANPDVAISTLDYLSEKEKKEQLTCFNSSHVNYPNDKTIVDLFEDKVVAFPNHIAIVFEDQELTYHELNQISNQLANYLHEKYELKPDDLVGVMLDRSANMIVAMLAILKAGAAYLPIDPDYPAERITFMVRDSGCKLVIDNVLFSTFSKEQNTLPKINLPQVSTPRNLAYVIYTSGTTGQPKGVLIEHQNVVRLFKTDSPLFDFNDQDVWTMFHSFCFDFSVWEIYGALFFGGKLVIVPAMEAKDPTAYLNLLKKNKVTVLNQTPSAFYNLAKEEGLLDIPDLHVRYVIFGGEALSPGKLDTWKRRYPNTSLINMYGITETTVHVTFKEIGQYEIDNNISNIGKPIPTLNCFVLDEHHRFLPYGMLGELYIAGPGVARGYLNRPQLTAEKFITTPFSNGNRLYRSGDLVRILPNGEMEYKGRIDDQVKIRGYRIELGEIENKLVQIDGVDDAVVVVKKDEIGTAHLIAYLLSEKELHSDSLRKNLGEQLPDYMIPAHFIELDSFPLTANGKVDKKALTNLDGISIATGIQYVAARSVQEKILVEVWTEVLKKDKISVRDNFLNLGGDSIKSIQVVSRVKQYGYILKVEHVLRTPVLEDLAVLMQLKTKETDQSEVLGSVILTPIQEWFFNDDSIKEHNHFNQSVILKSNLKLDRNALEKSLEMLTFHHDALRMIFNKKDGIWKQSNQSANSKHFSFDFYDLTEHNDPENEISKLGQILQTSLNIENGPLLKVAHLRLDDSERLGIIIHHLVVDGVSWRILLEDLSKCYGSYLRGETPELPFKTDSFQQWARVQKEYANNDGLNKERAYWEEVCNQKISLLPRDKEEVATSKSDSIETFHLSRATTKILQTKVNEVYNTEINDILLTALGRSIREVFNVDKVVLKMEGHGREQLVDGIDISRTVGWFTTMYPFILDVSKSDELIENLIDVKEALRKVPQKGIGYGMLKYLTKQGLQNELKQEVIFNYLGDFGSHIGTKEEAMFDYASESMGMSLSPQNENSEVLEVSGMLVKDELNISVNYSSALYKKNTIKTLIESYEKHLINLIENLSNSTSTFLTPSDLTYKGLDIKEVNLLNLDGNLEDVYELSPLQEGIYFFWLSDKKSSVYFEQLSYRVTADELEISKLETAYNKLIDRHVVLRTSFQKDYGNTLLQIVKKSVSSNFTYEKIEADSFEKKLEGIKRVDQEKGFDLNSGSQMRLHIVDLSNGQYEFIWSHHHILMDGWCVSVLIHDFNSLFTAEVIGKSFELAKPTPYSSYINWLKKQDENKPRAYWDSFLEGYNESTEIPFKINNPTDAYKGDVEQLDIEVEIFEKMDAFCKQIGITLNTFIQGSWGYLLSKYNRTKDVVFGTVVSGRQADLEGIEEMIGLFINTIPVRVKYEPIETVRDLFTNLHEESIRSTAHHFMNLSDVQSRSGMGADLINHILVFENYAKKELANGGMFDSRQENSISVNSIELFERTNYDFNIIINPANEELALNFLYNQSQYDKDGIQELIVNYKNLIVTLLKSPEKQLKDIQFLSPETTVELCETFNNTSIDYQDKTVLELFEDQVERTPNLIAVEFENGNLTYEELNNESNILSKHLLAKIDRSNADFTTENAPQIGVMLERSLDSVVSMIAIMKIGAVYVPIDHDYPTSRVSFIIEDASLQLIVSKAAFLEKHNIAEEKLIELDEIEISSGITPNPKRKIQLNQGAFVIYTSGSTGKPKGVFKTHKMLSNLIQWDINHSGIKPGLKYLQYSSFSFDASLHEIYFTLATGGTAFITSDTSRIDYPILINEIVDRKVEVLSLPFSALNALCQEVDLSKIEGHSIRYVISTGEQLYVNARLKDFLEKNPEIELHNHYGPSETHVVTSHKMSAQLANVETRSSIGKPISNTVAYILD